MNNKILYFRSFIILAVFCIFSFGCKEDELGLKSNKSVEIRDKSYYDSLLNYYDTVRINQMIKDGLIKNSEPVAPVLIEVTKDK